jgi:hypothetical protein
MEDTEDEVIIPAVKKYKINDQVLGVRTCRKVAQRTRPSFLPAAAAAAAAAAENPTLTPLKEEDLPVAKRKRTMPPPLKEEDLPVAKRKRTMPPPLEEEDLPVAKRLRLRRQAPTSISTAADEVVNHAHTADTATTDSADDTPTDPVVSPAALLPIATTSRAPLHRWKPAEDAKLMEAVKKHGNNWVAVAKLVPGRTNEQCRKRWVRTLDPANNGTNLTNGKKGKWTPAEDAKLTEAVKKHDNDWVAVAAMVPGRTNKQCRQRWALSLDPADHVKKPGKWSPEEDAKLRKAVKTNGNDWVAVANLVPGRTNVQCCTHFRTLDPAHHGKKPGKWSPEEDAKLRKAVKQHY